MASTTLTSAAPSLSDPSLPGAKVIEMDDENDDAADDSAIDEEQLEEYRDMVEQLGGFPDKVKINSLSMVAEDHADSKSSARQIYAVIRDRLVSTTTHPANLLPLVYVIDSILKNVRGQFVTILEDDAATWLPVVYQRLPDLHQRQKLRKVYQTWVDARLFREDRLRDMGRCFEALGSTTSSTTTATASTSSQFLAAASASGALAGRLGTEMVAGTGIARAADGRLLLSPALRRAMEEILDQLQSDMENELDKVSLERLSYLNPELLGNIKQTAQENLRSTTSGANGTNGGGASASSTLPSYFVETRSDDEINRSQAWSDQKIKFPAESDAVIKRIKELVDHERPGWDGEKLYTRREATAWTRALAAALATSSHLQQAAERLQQQKSRKPPSGGGGGGTSRTGAPFRGGAYGSIGGAGGGIGFSAVDKSLFTNRGVKERNDTVIGLLYEVGLPFVSSVDGKRFATQQELSSHLDALFRRNQLEKSIARTEERGWFVSEFVWTLEAKSGDATDPLGAVANSTTMTRGGGEFDVPTGGARDASSNDGFDPATSTVPADETRDRCVVCGINFKMVFDNDEGVYKYTNCREIEMLNDDAADVESEPVLAHVTCWRGLGSPDVLTADQALQETLHHYSY